MIAHLARAALTPEDEALLASVRKALADIWADPVFVRHVAMSRSAARAIERHLSALSLRRASSLRAGLAIPPSGKPQPYTAPRSSQQPTLARGCEAEPAARNSSAHRRGDKRKHTTLGMVRRGEFFIHDGETCA
ncbi:hypothetical protein [Synechococcus phage Ssp-JY40]